MKFRNPIRSLMRRLKRSSATSAANTPIASPPPAKTDAETQTLCTKIALVAEMQRLREGIIALAGSMSEAGILEVENKARSLLIQSIAFKSLLLDAKNFDSFLALANESIERPPGKSPNEFPVYQRLPMTILLLDISELKTLEAEARGVAARFIMERARSMDVLRLATLKQTADSLFATQKEAV